VSFCQPFRIFIAETTERISMALSLEGYSHRRLLLAQWPCHSTGCIFTTAVHVRSQGRSRGICGGHGDSGTGFPLHCESFEFPLSVSFYRGSIFTHVSWGGGGGGLDRGPLTVALPQGQSLDHRNDKRTYFT
jgi:hypothetical protein